MKSEEENTTDSTIKPEDTTNQEEQTLKISLGTTLPRNDEEITTEAGDILTK